MTKIAVTQLERKLIKALAMTAVHGVENEIIERYRALGQDDWNDNYGVRECREIVKMIRNNKPVQINAGSRIADALAYTVQTARIPLDLWEQEIGIEVIHPDPQNTLP